MQSLRSALRTQPGHSSACAPARCHATAHQWHVSHANACTPAPESACRPTARRHPHWSPVPASAERAASVGTHVTAIATIVAHPLPSSGSRCHPTRTGPPRAPSTALARHLSVTSTHGESRHPTSATIPRVPSPCAWQSRASALCGHGAGWAFRGGGTCISATSNPSAYRTSALPRRPCSPRAGPKPTFAWPAPSHLPHPQRPHESTYKMLPVYPSTAATSWQTPRAHSNSSTCTQTAGGVHVRPHPATRPTSRRPWRARRPHSRPSSPVTKPLPPTIGESTRTCRASPWCRP